MPDTINMQGAFDTMRDAVAEEFGSSGDTMISDLREMLSVPVTYTSGPRGGKKAIRSVTPQPPRYETGALWESIGRVIATELYGVEMAVYTDKIYSAILQDTNYRTGPRLHWSTLFENWVDVLPQRVAEKLAQL